MIFDVWTKDISQVDDWHLICGWMTFDMWTNEIWCEKNNISSSVLGACPQLGICTNICTNNTAYVNWLQRAVVAASVSIIFDTFDTFSRVIWNKWCTLMINSTLKLYKYNNKIRIAQSVYIIFCEQVDV